MKKTTLFFIIINISITSFSQAIRGTVFDNDSKKPIPYASVFFNGTTLGTTTDDHGNFSLDISNNRTLPIAISAIGYYSTLLSDYSTDKNQLVYLNQKAYELKEIIVYANKSYRKKYLEIFHNQFLGQTPNASECTIINEDEIVFNYKEDSDLLITTSLNPLIINNNALGYQITYYLDKFEYSPTRKSLTILGNYIFKDDMASQGQDSAKLNRKRKSAYLGSRMHFFRSLWENHIDADGYSIRSLSNEKLTYDSLVITTGTSNKYLLYKGKMDIGYFDKYGGTILELTEEATFFDKNGYFDPYSIVWSGIMARQRIADLLPFDFVLIE